MYFSRFLLTIPLLLTIISNTTTFFHRPQPLNRPSWPTISFDFSFVSSWLHSLSSTGYAILIYIIVSFLSQLSLYVWLSILSLSHEIQSNFCSVIFDHAFGFKIVCIFCSVKSIRVVKCPMNDICYIVPTTFILFLLTWRVLTNNPTSASVNRYCSYLFLISCLYFMWCNLSILLAHGQQRLEHPLLLLNAI